jgi:hypothetical protein
MTDKAAVRVTPRALLTGVFCTAALVAVTPYNDLYILGTYVAGNHFPVGAFAVLLALVLVVNPLLRRGRVGRPFSSAELLTVWVMTLVSSGVPSSGLFRYLLGSMIAPIYFATPENEWASLLHPHLSEWLTPLDPKLARDFYEGGDRVPWAGWVKPIIFWTPLILLVYLSMFSMCAILRRQWVEHERFTFPIMKVPMEVAGDPAAGRDLNAFFRSRWMWVGCAIPVVIHSINGLQRFVPAMPRIPMAFSLRPLFAEEPWVPLGWLIAIVFPSVIGVSYLITQEVAFSFWFFHIMYRVQETVLRATGSPIGGWEFVHHQELGAYVTGCCFLLWIARGHLRRVWGAFTGAFRVDDDGEPAPYRWAVVGLLLSTVAVAGMLTAVGMSYIVALATIVLFYVILVVLTWMVIDGGLLFITTTAAPSEFLIPILGTRTLGPANLVIPTIVEKSVMWDSREFVMPSVMNGMRAPDSAGVNRRHVLLAMGLALVVALPVGFVASLQLIYRHGALNLQHWTYQVSAPDFPRRVAGYLNAPLAPDLTNVSVMAGGALFMLFLCVMRLRVVWWPAHPIGYIAFSKYHAHNLWFAIFLGWLMKLIVLRVGGVQLYRQLRPAFLGLIVGESLMAAVFVVVALITGRGYSFLPG